MMRSMFASVSGLKAHQTRMDVIGNNIANVNTVGYRASRVTFQEVYSQTIKGAGAPDPISGRGGTNPLQVGLGINVGAIDTITTRGSIQRTDYPLDLSIDGEGFFIAKANEGDTFMFTRAGNFTIDELGNLVTANGMRVYGWLDYGGKANPDGTYTFDVEKDVEPINVYADDYNKNKKIIAPKATTEVVLSGNLSSEYPNIADPTTADPQFSVPLTIYDSLGNSYQVRVNFWHSNDYGGATADVEDWAWEIVPGPGLTVTSGDTGVIGFDMTDVSPGRITGTSTFTVTFQPSSGLHAFDVDIDFSKVTMFAADNSSVKPISIDGYTTGSFVSLSVGADGMITGIYSNGQQQPLGLIALAVFENPAGLQRVGDNMFIPTTNSGDYTGGVKAGTGGAGSLNPGTLEMSNVDLANMFTDMIVTQRGFQANSRIMTTVDEMLQEISNMKR
jgi:flagellar hook protein FlgE